MSMTQHLPLVYPMLAQILLTLLLLMWLGTRRVRAITKGQVRSQDVQKSKDAWGEEISNIADNYNHQYEVPVLFLVLCLLIIQFNLTDMIFVSLAWFFVFTRLIHSWIQTGSNNVSYRFSVFLAGVFTVIAMLVLLGFKTIF